MKTPEQKTASDTFRHVFVEGWLYWYTAFGVTAQEFLSSEEAYKYINPALLFWSRMLIGSSVAGFNAVKAFRSMTYGRAYNTTAPNTPTAPTGNTTFIAKSETQQTNPPLTEI